MNMIDLVILGRLLQRLGSSRLHQDTQIDDVATPAEIMLLSEVFRAGPTTIGTLATRTGFVQSHVSTLAARLSERGLLQLRSDPTDRRRTLVSMPPGTMDRITASLLDDASPILAELVGDAAPVSLAEVEAALTVLLVRLRERFPGVDDTITLLKASHK